MNRRFLITGAFLGLTGIVLGAFAAHGLKEAISESALESFETGVRFQMYHAFLMLILGFSTLRFSKNPNWIFYLICTGILFFSGSIYLLATNDMWAFDFTRIALITPLGGSLLIITWIILLLNFIKLKKK